MQFTALENESERKIWDLILENLDPSIRLEVSSATSSFYKTADEVECSLRRSNGSLTANYYSGSDRMCGRRWSVAMSVN